MLKNFVLGVVIFNLYIQPTKGSEHFEGDLYHNNSKSQTEWAEGMISKIAPPNNMENFTIMDAGCRDGAITNALANKFPQARIVGIDPNKSLIDLAKATSTTIEWRNQAIEDIEDTNTYDLVTSFSALHWLKDPKKAISNISKAMKPGAKAYFVTTAKYDLESRIGYSLEFQRNSKKWKGYFLDTPKTDDIIKKYTLDDIKLMLNDSGLDISRGEMSQTKHTFPSENDFLDWVCSWSPFKVALSDKHREFWQDVIATYCVYIKPHDDGRIDYIDYNLHITFIKD